MALHGVGDVAGQGLHIAHGGVGAGVQGERTRACWWKLMDSWYLPSFLWVWPRWFRRLSHLSEREELRPDLDTLSTLGSASLKYFSALS